MRSTTASHAPAEASAAMRAPGSRTLHRAVAGERAARLAVAMTVLSGPAPWAVTMGMHMASGAWAPRDPTSTLLWWIVAAGAAAAGVIVGAAHAFARRARVAGAAGPALRGAVAASPWLATLGLALGAFGPLFDVAPLP